MSRAQRDRENTVERVVRSGALCTRCLPLWNFFSSSFSFSSFGGDLEYVWLVVANVCLEIGPNHIFALKELCNYFESKYMFTYFQLQIKHILRPRKTLK